MKTVAGVDDFASMREVVERRYRRIRDASNNGKDQAGAPCLDSETWDSTKSDAPAVKGTGLSPLKSAKTGGGLQAAEKLNRGSFVTGHDFSSAANAQDKSGALAPEEKPSKEPTTMPSLVLIDGGLGQLHAAAEALEFLGFTSQPLASIAKKEEIIYLHGSEDEPIVLDRRSPVLHLVQLIRDESHRFAVGYHRQRRAMRDRDSELLQIPGVGPQTRQRLLTHFGSLRDVQQATVESLAAVVSRKTAETLWRHFHREISPAPRQ
jgi:excinuclease UvrABC nuclease subunit